MAIKLFNGSNFNNIAQRFRVWRDGVGWTTATKISAYRDGGGSPFWSTVYPDLPFATVGSAVVGTAIPGNLLSLSNTNIWDTSLYRQVDSISYQWQRSTDEITWSNISLATSTTYTVQNADIGFYLRCRITATNERGSTVETTNRTQRVTGPEYIFTFGNELGVNSNGFILFDKVNGSFPAADTVLLAPGRLLGYFMGSFKHFRTWYKSDTTNFRIYHQLYRTDRATRPAAPDAEYEIIFTNNSNLVDIYVVNSVALQYIIYYIAYMVEYSTLSEYPSHLSNIRYRVTMNSPSSVSTASGTPSTTSPSFLNGWIQLDNSIDTEDTNVVFSPGTGQSSPISQNVNGAFTKSNMFFPSTPTVGTPAILTDTTALVSWTQGTANGFYVSVNRTSDNAQAYWTYTTGTSTTITGLTLGTEYTVSVSPISRSDFLGQFGFAGTKTWTHARPPNAPTNLSFSGTPTEDGLGVYWTVTWSAPLNNGGSAITNYEYAVDFTADNAQDNYGSWTSTGSTATSRVIGVFEGSRGKVKIRAVNAVGPGFESAELILPSSPTAPGTPTAGSINSTNASSTVSWTASNANGGSSLVYTVFRGQSQTTIANNRTLANTGSNTQANLSITDAVGGDGSATYYYRVIPYANYGSPSAQLSGIQSSVSSVLNVTGPSANTPTLGINNTNAGINVNWTGSAGSGNTPTYAVYRGQNSANLGTYGSGSLRANQTNTSISGDVPNSASTTYFYRVDVSNNIGTGQSGLGSITTPGPPNIPGRPSGTANNAQNNISLSWTASGANGGGTVTYAIYRGQNPTNLPSGGTFINNTTSTSYLDSYGSNATYYYRVVPSTVWGTGPQSNVSAGIVAS